MSLTRPLAGLIALSLALTTLTFVFSPEPADAHHRCGHREVVCTATSTTTTTTTPTTTSTWSGEKAVTRPVGSAPLSDAEAAARVRRSSWEPRPENDTPNHRVPTSIELSSFRSVNAAPAWYKDKVTGNFTGTTDEIIQWAAHKWGIDEDVFRAVAVQESWWRMS
ncbi:MAG TPA: hypothetical protein VGR26_09375, partial [Acidimicrobiales bacterium]|nr:hypothetical protein [Acidimicrobiales bacterium]